MAYTGLGATIEICETLPATYDKAGFEDAGLTYNKIKGALTNMVSIGGEWGSTSDTIVETGEQVMSKTSRSATSFTVSIFADAVDAGSAMIRAAFESRDYYAFRVTNSMGRKAYFMAKVMSNADNTHDTEAHDKEEFTIQPRAIAPVKVDPV